MASVTDISARVNDDEPGDWDLYGWTLVAAQIAAAAVVVWPGDPRWRVPRAVRRAGLALAGAGAMVSAAAALRLGKALRAEPRPAATAALHRDGLYAYVRHPVYAGVLASATGVTIARGRPESIVGLACLSGVLHVKAGYEERLLRQKFGAEYDDYAGLTPRLVPWSGSSAPGSRPRRR